MKEDKIYPNLYILDSKKKVRIFKCRIIAPINEEANKFIIITETGVLNGKLIPHSTFTKIKGNKSIEAQAILEADAIYNAKFDEGYKSKELILKSIADYNYGYSSIHNFTDNELENILKNHLWLSYTNKNSDELPQLAHKFKDIKKPAWPYIIQPKLDGVRALSKVKNGHPLICSRGGKYYLVPIILRQLEELFKHAKEILGEEVILDGELYKHGILRQDISGAARTEEDLLFGSNDWLEYHIYDIIPINNLEMPQGERYQLLKALSISISRYPNIKVVETNIVHNQEELDNAHKYRYVALGYEGSILRDVNGVYEFNNRSRSLLKYKDFKDEEFIIEGSEYDSNNIEESFVFILKDNIDSTKIFKAKPTGTNIMKSHWYKNREKYIGKRATVRFFDRSKDGIPSMGHVEHKLTPCLIEHIRPTDE